jgi:hypothetical protein
VLLDVVDRIRQSGTVVIEGKRPGFLRPVWKTDIHVWPTMSCVKPNNRLPLASYHRQILDGKLAYPDLIFIAQHYRELFALSLAGLRHQPTHHKPWLRVLYRLCKWLSIAEKEGLRSG